MAKITDEHIKKTYAYGKKAYTEGISTIKLSRKMAEESTMKEASAKMYIQAVKNMMEGKPYTRSISQKATELIFTKILEDFDESILENAIRSVEQYIDYHELRGKRKPSLKQLVEKYKNAKQTCFWIFQGNPKKWDIDKYLTEHNYVYWSINVNKDRAKAGDKVFIWRAQGRRKSAYGFVGIGTIVERPKLFKDLNHPKSVLKNDIEENDKKVRVGIKLDEIRLTEEQGMINANIIKEHNLFKDSALIKARQGSSFPISKEQFKAISEIWDQKPQQTENTTGDVMYQSQHLNEYTQKINTKFHITAHKGQFLEFWSEYSQSKTHFIIGYKQIADGLKTILENTSNLENLQKYDEGTWRSLPNTQKETPVFQTLISTQTACIFHTISQILHWANNEPPSAYKDKEITLDKSRAYKAIKALNTLHAEGHKTNIVSSENENKRVHNLIVYGAPGSGKSHHIKQFTEGKQVIRTVFHPEYQNADFVGSLRPYQKDNEITYSFIPGPFIEALLLANNTSEQVYLVIEEINRANAAAVFGDIFQLLDRDSSGNSEYSITPEKTLQQYLTEQGYANATQLHIPANLSIVATMNSSDQGVFLLDTAFKRRWEFQYSPINFDKHQNKKPFTDKIVPYKNSFFSWCAFAETINSALKKHEVEEDRLIGPYFLTDKERTSSKVCKTAISGKLLIYLWDDVLRHGLRHLVFSSTIRTFSELAHAYETGESIFSEDIEHSFESEEKIIDA